MYFNKGISTRALQTLLGHDGLTTTEIYLNLSPEDAIREFLNKRNGSKVSVFIKETELVEFLAKKIKLQSYYKEVYPNINLASRKFYPYWRKWFTRDPSDFLYPLAQPQIDIIVLDKDHRLLGVEVKYFKFYKKNPRPTLPFYEGIEQALALLRFGFVCVSLWQCFDFEEASGDLGVVRRYMSATRELVNLVKLPINYSGLWIAKGERGGQATYLPFPVTSWFDNKSHFKLPPQLPSLYGKDNPAQSMQQVKRMNEFLRISLKIPLPEDQSQTPISQ